jgi:hypothetical protein
LSYIKMSGVICTPKKLSFLGQLSCSLVTKIIKWEEERESENVMRVWERVVQNCQYFGCTNIISQLKIHKRH